MSMFLQNNIHNKGKISLSTLTQKSSKSTQLIWENYALYFNKYKTFPIIPFIGLSLIQNATSH